MRRLFCLEPETLLSAGEAVGVSLLVRVTSQVICPLDIDLGRAFLLKNVHRLSYLSFAIILIL